MSRADAFIVTSDGRWIAKVDIDPAKTKDGVIYLFDGRVFKA